MRKKIAMEPLILIGLLIIFIAGCRKNYKCRTCFEIRKPPIANAGRDTTIFLPVNKILLDGSGSSDPDGSIVSYHWKRLSGDASHLRFENENAVQTQATELTEGEYIFALEVADNTLLTSSDAVVVNVKR